MQLRQNGRGEALISQRIEVVGRGVGTVVDMHHTRGQPTQHIIMFDNGSRDALTLSKNSADPSKNGHAFFMVSPDA